ncbi:isocitrate/isopropylmalate family dehydrogenase [Saccharothrix obliqua]|uniref:isocitrate/isopropylmalate family dehydrogenase n=1 Tax=Saccharothrix obliqua TaxID=2861747 RepID=UPI001C6075EA|nr:isocitrate/isopropylmalate family dehydrogenase [Saccharothrix obliqua]MBW4717172.1 isocitrate dehydrogenase [Saccharothrix obliqua]
MGAVVGLAVGRGTGAELAAVFERVLGVLAARHGVAVAVERSPRVYHSYFSLRDEADLAAMRERTREDAEHYEEFCRGLVRRGVDVVFRTAVNAQSLYQVRERLRAVKVDVLGELMVVRDQAQGFYAGENEHSPGVVERTTVFRRDVTRDVLSFALRRARERWPAGPAEVVLAYKFHLLDGAFERWVREFVAEHGVAVRLSQPDTANRDLLAREPLPRTLIVAGNEWGDIMHAVLLHRFGTRRPEDRCGENAYLHPDVAGLVEYQTVHGSADDIAGQGVVNPVATVRAAAAVAERVGCTGAVAEVEEALAALARNGIRTPDTGGHHTTQALVNVLLIELERHDGVPVAG